MVNPQRILTESEVLASEFGGGSAGTKNDLESLTMVRNIGMMCNKIDMLSSRDINTTKHIMYGLSKREMHMHIVLVVQLKQLFMVINF